MRRALARVGSLMVLAVLLAAASLGCSWLIGVSGDPVLTDGPGSDSGDEEAGDAGADADPDAAGDAAQDAATE